MPQGKAQDGGGSNSGAVDDFWTDFEQVSSTSVSLCFSPLKMSLVIVELMAGQDGK